MSKNAINSAFKLLRNIYVVDNTERSLSSLNTLMKARDEEDTDRFARYLNAVIEYCQELKESLQNGKA